MTLREKMKMEMPEIVNNEYEGGVSGCPREYNFLNVSDRECTFTDGEYDCKKCWDREYKDKAEKLEETDNVNHPAHYEIGGIECIDVMIETQGIEAVKSFCICNAFKYIYRHKNKNGDEDLKKASWYLDKYIDLISKGD